MESDLIIHETCLGSELIFFVKVEKKRIQKKTKRKQKENKKKTKRKQSEHKENKKKTKRKQKESKEKTKCESFLTNDN